MLFEYFEGFNHIGVIHSAVTWNSWVRLHEGQLAQTWHYTQPPQKHCYFISSFVTSVTSFGFTNNGANSQRAIGVYGNGFKSGSMRVGALSSSPRPEAARAWECCLPGKSREAISVPSPTVKWPISFMRGLAPVQNLWRSIKSLVVVDNSLDCLHDIARSLAHSLTLRPSWEPGRSGFITLTALHVSP